MGPILNK